MLLLLAALSAGCLSFPAVTHAPGIKGRIVYSCNMTLPDGTRLHEGAPLTDALLLASIGVCNVSPGGVGPHVARGKTWSHYTFTDRNGSFRIPMQWGLYIATVGLLSNTEIDSPSLEIFEPTRSCKIEGGNERIWPYRIYTPGPVSSNALAEVRALNAGPVHWSDRAKLRELRKRLKASANNASQPTK